MHLILRLFALLVILEGIGSGIYHLSGFYSFGILDSLPMLLLMVTLSTVWIDSFARERLSPKTGKMVSGVAIFVMWFLLLCALCLQHSEGNYDTIDITFGALATINVLGTVIGFFVRLCKKDNKRVKERFCVRHRFFSCVSRREVEENAEVRHIIWHTAPELFQDETYRTKAREAIELNHMRIYFLAVKGTCFFLIGFAFHLMDAPEHAMCSELWHAYLGFHVIWHAFTASALYCLVLVAIYFEYRSRKGVVVLLRQALPLHLLPYVTLVPDPSVADLTPDVHDDVAFIETFQMSALETEDGFRWCICCRKKRQGAQVTPDESDIEAVAKPL
jgi:hypothetical protein